MRSLLACAVLGALISATAWAGQQKAPTLGAQGQAPGQSTPVTTDRKRLQTVHALYIKPIDNGLNAKLIQTLGSLGWARVVDQPGGADAILQGTCFDDHRLKEVHSEIFVNDSASGASIWQDVIRVRAFPPSLAQAVAETASKAASDLRQALEGGEGH